MKVHGCASCGARFPTYGGLQEHLLTHRTVCRTCNRAFTRRANLLKHKCETAGDHSCESCRRTFSTRYTLKRHLRDTSCSQPQPPEPKRQRVSGHEEDPDDVTQHVHGCTSCGARFPTYGGLREHLLTHRTVCRTSNRAFSRRANLLKHKCETAGDHSCESCRRTFSTRYKLKRHLR